MAIGVSAQLDALRALLATAERLSDDLASDATVGRLLRAFMMLPPDDRAIVAQVVERSAVWLRIADATADVAGVRMHANPQARLYVRRLDPTECERQMEQERDEVLVAILRLLKRVPLLIRPEVAAFWRTPAIEALRSLGPAEREACVELAHLVIALVAEVHVDGERGAPA